MGKYWCKSFFCILQFSLRPSICVSSYIKLPSILLEICSGEKGDVRTNDLCSPFGEHKYFCLAMSKTHVLSAILHSGLAINKPTLSQKNIICFRFIKLSASILRNVINLTRFP